MTGPGLFGAQRLALKSIQIHEKVKLDLRCEAFGLTNTPQFSNPGNILGNCHFRLRYRNSYGSGSGVNAPAAACLPARAKLSF